MVSDCGERAHFPSVQRITRCAPGFAGQPLRTWDPTAKQENNANRSRRAGFQSSLNRLKPAKQSAPRAQESSEQVRRG